jgi:hypothetical protein
MRKEIAITVKPVLALSNGHIYRVTKLVNAVRVECDGKQDMEEGMLDSEIETIERVTRIRNERAAKIALLNIAIASLKTAITGYELELTRIERTTFDS